MIVKVLLRHLRDINPSTGRKKETTLDIWNIDPAEAARILQADRYSSHRNAILDAFVKHHVLPRIPDTYKNYEYVDWSFADHSEADIYDTVERSAAEKKMRAKEAQKIHNNLLVNQQNVHSRTA